MPDDLTGTIIPAGALVVPSGVPGPSGTGDGGGVGIWRLDSYPPDPNATPLWWRPEHAQLYVWTGAEFVVATNQPNLSGPGPAGPPGAPGATGPMGPAGPGAEIPDGQAVNDVLMWSGAEWFPAQLPSGPGGPSLIGLTLSNDTFTESALAQPLGTLTAQTMGGSFAGSYSISGTDVTAGRFTHVGPAVSVTAGVPAGSYSLTATATDANLGGSPLSRTFAITGQGAPPPPPPGYSEIEQQTDDYWLNGEPIYQKTIIINTPLPTAAGTTASFPHDIGNFGRLVSADIIGHQADGDKIPVPGNESYVTVSQSNITIGVGFAKTIPSAPTTTCTLRYTRTGESGIGAGHSATEQPTGVRWLDGRPIYRRTVTRSGSYTAGTTENFPHPITGAHEVVAVRDGVIQLPSNVWGIVPNADFFSWFDPTHISLQARFANFAPAITTDFTIYYTRTNDAAPGPNAGGPQYSNAEQDTGLKWIDGTSTVYEKVVSGLGAAGGATSSTPHNISNPQIISLIPTVTIDTDPAIMFQPTQDVTRVWTTPTAINFILDTTWGATVQNRPVNYILRYTRS